MWQNCEQVLPHMHYARGMCFTDVNTGWVVGTKGSILATTNGGSNWNFQQSGVEFDLPEGFVVSIDPV